MWTRRTSLRSGVSSRVSRVSVPPARPRGIPGHVFVRVCVYFYVYFLPKHRSPAFFATKKKKLRACV
jgi:hypothetical protein